MAPTILTTDLLRVFLYNNNLATSITNFFAQPESDRWQDRWTTRSSPCCSSSVNKVNNAAVRMNLSYPVEKSIKYIGAIAAPESAKR